MKNLLQKFKENKKLKNRVIAAVSAMLAFALFVSSVIVYQKSKQNIKAAENKSQNALEETLKNEQTNENAESKNLSNAAAENFETELSSDSALDSDKDVTVPISKKTSEQSKQISAVSSTQKDSTSGKKPNRATQNSVKPTKPTTANSTTEPEYYTVKYCEAGNHQWNSWIVEDGQNHYRTCKICQAEDYNENWEWKPEYHMGNKAEYMELLGYINKARREAGLHEYSYKSEWQAGADQRAVDLTQSFSHKRPGGRGAATAYTDLGYNVWGFAECIASGYGNAKAVFNGWMNSEGHRKILMSSAENSEVAIARCGTYWVINIL